MVHWLFLCSKDNKTNDLIEIASLAEEIIIYGNRYRSSYTEVNLGLEQAEVLFKKGLYNESFKLSQETLEKVDANIRKKFSI